MKRCLVVFLISFSGCSSFAGSTAGEGTICQVGTYTDLLNGNFDGEVTLDQLLEHGNFGLGTFDKINGEMIVVNDTVYQILSTGSVNVPDRSVTTPFAVVNRFEPDRSLLVGEQKNFAALRSTLDTVLNDTSSLYAIRIQGAFRTIIARSVPVQSKPYPVLDKVIRHQTLYEYADIEGVMVGFFTPLQYAGIGAEGYHFHFISADRMSGGHVLDVHLQSCEIAIDRAKNIDILFRGTGK